MGVRVAALYDVHGNLPALDAVLEEVAREAPDVVVFGGDLLWGPWPSECLQRAESLGDRAVFVHGNCERLVLEGAGPGHTWARERLSPAQRARVETWPMTATLEIEVLGRTLFCHATPRSDEEILSPESPGRAWAEAFAGVEQRLVVCGHTHLQFDRELGGRRVVNPGSVGAPTVRPAAWWALLGPDVELRVTDYDTEGTIAAASKFFSDEDELIRWLRHPPSYEERARRLASP